MLNGIAGLVAPGTVTLDHSRVDKNDPDNCDPQNDRGVQRLEQVVYPGLPGAGRCQRQLGPEEVTGRIVRLAHGSSLRGRRLRVLPECWRWEFVGGKEEGPPDGGPSFARASRARVVSKLCRLLPSCET